jgi:hypothetical protein
MFAAGAGLIGLLALVIGIGCLICFVIVLIKQFQDAGVVHGIIGIVTCGIWTFIWGWMNSSRLNLRTIMLIWTLLIIVSIVLRVVFLGGMVATGNLPMR